MVRILTQNVWTPVVGSGPHSRARLQQLVDNVGEYDVLLLQEVFHLHIFGKRKLGHGAWLAAALRKVGFNYILLPRQHGGLQIQDGGLMIASKYPISDVRHIVYAEKRHPELWTAKGAVGFRVNIPGVPPLPFVNTHLQAWEGAANAGVRSWQLLQLRQLVDVEGWRDVLVCGDFNLDGTLMGDCEYDAMMRILEPVLDPAAGNNRMRAEHTYPSDKPECRLDYILHHKPTNWKLSNVKRVKIGNTMAHTGYSGCSDHYGVEATALSEK